METNTASEPFILFEVSGTTYGVRSSLVQQVEMIEDIAAVPNAPAAVEGVAFVRGQVVPAMNLRVRFGFARIDHDLRSRLVVINTGARVVGLIVDAAREFLKIPSSAIAPPPESITGLSGQYLEGIATLGERLVLILNLDAVLDLNYELEDAVARA